MKRFALALALAASFVACTGSSDPEPAPSTAIPEGLGGGSSVGAKGGSAGSAQAGAGSAGTGGTAGNGGSAGVAAKGGAAGSAGKAGSAGSAGKAGSAGSAGKGGASGAAGTSGKGGAGGAGTSGGAGTGGAGGAGKGGASAAGTGGATSSGGAGSGATAGSSGAAGDPGTGGAAGDPGTGGAAGDPGTGGAAGDPGTGGAAGDPGAGGTTGFVCDPPAQDGELYALSTETLVKHDQVSMCQYRGEVLLVVNVASYCSNTPQYTALQDLEAKYYDQGFRLLGFPCNQFGAQEPGTEGEIQQFCSETYKVTFDMFKPIDVNGPDESPIYTWLKAQPGGEGDIEWNFAKFIVSRTGKVVARIPAGTWPDEPYVVALIEEELAK